MKNEEIKDDFKAKGLLEAKEKLDLLKLDPAEKADYESYIYKLRRESSLYKSSYVSGRLDGKEEGIVLGKNEVAINLIRLNLLSDQQIAQSTGLTIEQVQALRRGLD